MKLMMTGIDYESFPIEERERLALTKTDMIRMLSHMKSLPGVEGCIYISTCNRSELYLWGGDEVDPFSTLWDGIVQAGEEGEGISGFYEEYRAKAVYREEQDAIHHLFQLGCGMKSRIFGEDQILSQLKDSLELARQAESVCPALDRLFLCAITAGKKVKSEIRLTRVSASIVSQMSKLIEEEADRAWQGSTAGKQCLVIGNGEIGRLAASRMLELGMDVTVTVRHYKTKEVIIPVGCRIIDYSQRYEAAEKADIIISATASPHHTLLWDESLFSDGRKRYLFDLAVPRDISSEYGTLPNICLYDVDEISKVSGSEAADEEAVQEAERILKKAEEDYCVWRNFQGMIPAVQHIGELAANDAAARTRKRIRKAVEKLSNPPEKKRADTCDLLPEEPAKGRNHRETEEEACAVIESAVKDAVKKVVNNLMYDMKEEMTRKQWEDCIAAMEASVLKRQ